MKRLIVYDLDGTLVDTLGDIVQAANHMLGELGSPALAAGDIRRYIGSGVQELLTHCLKTDDPARVAQGVTLFRAYYTAHLVDHSQLYPGARTVLDHFRARRQAVITNKPNPYASDILHALGVADYFCEIVGGESAFPKKPDPAALLALMEQARVGPPETVFIGDSPIDVETGRRAGVTTAMVLHGFSDEAELRVAEPDVLVKDFSELLRAAKQAGW